MLVRLAVLVLCGLPAACTLLGCQAAGPAPAPRIVQRDLLYSPLHPELTGFDAPRADWPAAYRSGPTYEIIETQSRLIDQQNPHSPNNDYIYRRFEEIRSSRYVR